MTASLVVEMPGEPPFEVRLDPDVVSVGRAEDNVLSLRDMNVSRHHFSVERKGEFSVIQDRGSRNGTLVNGVAVLNKVLVEGDRVHVGGSVLTFRAQASNNALPPDEIPRPTAKVRLPSNFGLSPFPGQIRAPGTSPASTRPYDPRPVELSATDDPDVAASASASTADSKEPGTRHGGDSPSRRVAIEKEETRWRTLAEVACAVNGEHDLDRLLERILDAVLSLVPAKAGFLVLREGDELRVRANRNAANIKVGSTLGEIVAGEDKLRLSRQICEEAIAKKRPVLTQDAVSDQRLNQFLSVVSLQLKSILCVPFSSNEEVLGVVYLDEPTCDPFDDEGEAVDLVGAFGDLAGIALANAQLMAGIAERERLEKELAIASQIQKSLLPKAPPPVDGLQLAGKTVSALQVGGDLFDYFLRERPQQDVLISIGDVAGKGVGAGLVMATVRALLHAYAELYAKTDELLVQLNAVLSQNLDPGIFVSYLLIRYDQGTGILHYTGAGHEHLILYRPSTGQMEFLRAGGVVLGLVGAIGDKIKEKQMKLRADDVVVLYTDGATEAQGATTEEFGLERIGAAIKAGPLEPEAIVDRIMNAVKAFTGEDRQLHDDLTVVAIRKT